MSSRILVVDDEPRVCQFLRTILEAEGWQVTIAPGGAEALEELRRSSFDLVITDLVMPGVDGMQVLEAARAEDPDAFVIVITGYSTVESAVEAMKKGAFDYIPKPFKVEHIKLQCRKALEQRRVVLENRVLRHQLSVTGVRFGRMIGDSPAMQEVYRLISKVAPTDSTVLIRGETGTGKELVARAIHYHSPRREHPLVTVNCAALPEALLESELFGYARGAFTGATAPKRGLLEEADGGTFFLDEIGDISLALQVKLLRVLEEGEFLRLGETRPRRVDVRVIAATNRDLEAALASGAFRPDLYFRLNVFTINLPRLRDREGDVPLLASHFLHRSAQRMGKALRGFTPRAMECLCRYPWPGNVRELENVVERAAILAEGPFVDVGDLPREMQHSGDYPPAQFAGAGGKTFKEAVREFERSLVVEALARAGGVPARAARLLGVSRSTFHEITRRLGLQEEVRAGSRTGPSPA
ncbi:MAG: sigma-54 dependent transcriptional regulator [Bacillota bacterium]